MGAYTDPSQKECHEEEGQEEGREGKGASHSAMALSGVGGGLHPNAHCIDPGIWLPAPLGRA